MDAAEAGGLAALAGRLGPVEAMIHCLSGRSGRDPAAYRRTYVVTLRMLCEVFAPARVLFTSSTGVYPQDDGSWVDEDSPTATPDEHGSSTASVLRAAEEIVLAGGGTVARLAGIYGPGRTRFLDWALGDRPEPPGPPLGWLNLIHRDDAARALFHLGAVQPSPGIFNVTDGSPARRLDLANALRRVRGLPAWPVPEGPQEGPGLNKRIANTRLCATGWTPQFPSLAAFAGS